VCSRVEIGGLGIKGIECFNIALLGKWKSRYGILEKGLWSEVLNANYGTWRNLDVTMIHRNHSTWWQDLCRILYKDTHGNWFNGRCHWILGECRRVKFWDDRWADGHVLKEKFPRLYMIS